ncbi:DUF2680 domain-containing protein [Epibacterium ulvae]|uniref:DUF2680 domain-containing protein n=1 Tax=Epibacterium ulvae TaxID=1156985 RepID=UPI00248FEF28|nr:DUF2680 domain-containing protein [Epibacterium ulvae]
MIVSMIIQQIQQAIAKAAAEKQAEQMNQQAQQQMQETQQMQQKINQELQQMMDKLEDLGLGNDSKPQQEAGGAPGGANQTGGAPGGPGGDLNMPDLNQPFGGLNLMQGEGENPLSQPFGGPIAEMIKALDELVNQTQNDAIAAEGQGGGGAVEGKPERPPVSDDPIKAAEQRLNTLNKLEDQLDNASNKVDKLVDQGVMTEAEGDKLKNQMERQFQRAEDKLVDNPKAFDKMELPDFKGMAGKLDKLQDITKQAEENKNEVDQRVASGEISAEDGEKIKNRIDAAVEKAKQAILDPDNSNDAVDKRPAQNSQQVSDDKVLEDVDKYLDKVDDNLNRIGETNKKIDNNNSLSDEGKEKMKNQLLQDALLKMP